VKGVPVVPSATPAAITLPGTAAPEVMPVAAAVFLQRYAAIRS